MRLVALTCLTLAALGLVAGQARAELLSGPELQGFALGMDQAQALTRLKELAKSGQLLCKPTNGNIEDCFAYVNRLPFQGDVATSLTLAFKNDSLEQLILTNDGIAPGSCSWAKVRESLKATVGAHPSPAAERPDVIYWEDASRHLYARQPGGNPCWVVFYSTKRFIAFQQELQRAAAAAEAAFSKK